LFFFRTSLAEYKKNSGYFSGGHSIGKIFLKVAPFFATYTEYCNKYELGASLIRTLKKENEKFTELLTKLERPHKQKGGLPLTSYLIMPVQRVPRYELLLRVKKKKIYFLISKTLFLGAFKDI